MPRAVDSRPSCLAFTGPVLIGGAGLVAAISLGLSPRDPSQAAGVFPVWWSQARTFEAAAETILTQEDRPWRS